MSFSPQRQCRDLLPYDGPQQCRTNCLRLRPPGLQAALLVDGGEHQAVRLLQRPPEQVGVGPPYVDAWTAAGGDPAEGRTCGQSGDLSNPEPDLRDRIDYVFVKGEIHAASRSTDYETEKYTPRYFSDHKYDYVLIGS